MRLSAVFHAILAGLLLGLAACAKDPAPTGPVIEVWKDPSCSCCAKWMDHLRANGFSVVVHEERKLNPLKSQLGIPQELWSCHTAKAAGYAIEGHVPAEDIKRLLAEKPTAKGLAVPNMPIGSPGMEMENRRDPYDVMLFGAAAQPSVWAHH
jgi:hypothetical protein